MNHEDILKMLGVIEFKIQDRPMSVLELDAIKFHVEQLYRLVVGRRDEKLREKSTDK